MLSNKQVALRDYLLQRLGFKNREFLEEYLSIITYSSKYYRNYRAIYPKKGERVDKDDPPKDYYIFDGEKWIPKYYTIIDYLIDEYSLKKEKKSKLTNNENRKTKFISATDLSAFSFCPVSFSIIKSLIVEVTTSAENGTHLHEEKRLLYKKIKKEGASTEGQDLEINDLINDRNKELFEDIKDSKLIYSGHGQNEKKYFTNKKGNFVGQPDYVFQKSNGKIFIVEEKFKRETWKKQYLFFRNHKHQIYSYIYGLDEFNADYGYLVYWTYEVEDQDQDQDQDQEDSFPFEDTSSYNNFTVTKCQVEKMNKSEKVRAELNQMFLSIKELISGQEINFDRSKLNPKKCGNCVVNRYCGHKTGRFEKFKFPYSLDYHKLWYASYPEELRKEKHNNQNESTKEANPSKHKEETNRVNYLTPEEQKNILNNLKW